MLLWFFIYGTTAQLFLSAYDFFPRSLQNRRVSLCELTNLFPGIRFLNAGAVDAFYNAAGIAWDAAASRKQDPGARSA